jgi:RHS repeat-associated protein
VSGRSFIYNLRFPGQYYQAETGLNYNYLRDYDPLTGRYVESDPSGLRGGINTYVYVEDDPIDGIDPFGRAKIHGNWCGSDWTGGYKTDFNSLTPDQRRNVAAAVDPLDEACERHDKCYGHCRDNFPCDQKKRSDCFLACDKVLENAAFQIGGFFGDVIGTVMARPGARNEPNAKDCPGCNNGGSK